MGRPPEEELHHKRSEDLAALRRAEGQATQALAEWGASTSAAARVHRAEVTESARAIQVSRYRKHVNFGC